ncbi:heterogeneous nuclear ribonucleoprotein A3 [Planoprotostelium fungivorum]|uniref:Heterogeneous nuclear ribonucleoprotein A3 n=1 Tax=Planoprotostelium fungivorum TaxID=1890364 RepID=A0A2P6N867_9EUKA|nr:heterogeneous nuclear ribonucleoprotein A3 [Planoprotostelium fungivorum]
MSEEGVQNDLTQQQEVTSEVMNTTSTSDNSASISEVILPPETTSEPAAPSVSGDVTQATSEGSSNAVVTEEYQPEEYIPQEVPFDHSGTTEPTQATQAPTIMEEKRGEEGSTAAQLAQPDGQKPEERTQRETTNAEYQQGQGERDGHTEQGGQREQDGERGQHVHGNQDPRQEAYNRRSDDGNHNRQEGYDPREGQERHDPRHDGRDEGHGHDGRRYDDRDRYDRRGQGSPSRNDPNKGSNEEDDTLKLFVGQLPREMTPQQLREIFAPYGEIVYCDILTDRETGRSKNCGFVTFAHIADAETAMNALHAREVLPGANNPMQVKFAASEAEKMNMKIFTGMLPKNYDENDMRTLFEPFGEITDLILLKGTNGESKGCGFVRYKDRDSVRNAIKGLDNRQVEKGGVSSKITVRLAESKKGPPGSSAPAQRDHHRGNSGGYAPVRNNDHGGHRGGGGYNNSGGNYGNNYNNNYNSGGGSAGYRDGYNRGGNGGYNNSGGYNNNSGNNAPNYGGGGYSNNSGYNSNYNGGGGNSGYGNYNANGGYANNNYGGSVGGSNYNNSGGYNNNAGGYSSGYNNNPTGYNNSNPSRVPANTAQPQANPVLPANFGFNNFPSYNGQPVSTIANNLLGMIGQMNPTTPAAGALTMPNAYNFQAGYNSNPAANNYGRLNMSALSALTGQAAALNQMGGFANPAQGGFPPNNYAGGFNNMNQSSPGRQ